MNSDCVRHVLYTRVVFYVFMSVVFFFFWHFLIYLRIKFYVQCKIIPPENIFVLLKHKHISISKPV